MFALTIKDQQLLYLERDTPAPGPRDVLVEVASAGVNAADLMQRQGFYPAPEGSPADIPGMELAGVVVAVGDDVSSTLLERRVCAVVGGGAQATHCVVPSEHLLLIPGDVNETEAGGFPEAFTTAFDALVTQGELQHGERVLISGAAGGVGVAGVQIAHAFGAEVVAVTRTRDHHDKLRSLGAHETVTIDQVNTVEPVDVVLELLGAINLSAAQSILRARARVVVIGVGGGARVEIDLLAMMRTRSSLTGSTLRARSRQEKAVVARLVSEQLIGRWSNRELTVPLSRTFTLDEGAAAYEYFAQPGKFGKVVLRCDV